MLERATKARGKPPSVNRRAEPLVEAMVREADALRIAVSKGSRGERLIDCGSEVQGGIEAGVRMAEICLGGLGTVTVTPDATFANWPFSLTGTFLAARDRLPRQPVRRLEAPRAGKTFFALGSGRRGRSPARRSCSTSSAIATSADSAVLVIEADGPPPADIVDEVLTPAASGPTG